MKSYVIELGVTSCWLGKEEAMVLETRLGVRNPFQNCQNTLGLTPGRLLGKLGICT